MRARYTGRALLIVLLLILQLTPTACICSHEKTTCEHLPGYCLTIRQYPGMDILLAVPLEKDRAFSLSFIHSVTMTPVQDHYVATPEGICQTSEIFESHCAGLPYSDQETGATRWELKNGRFILHMERKIPRLVVRTDRNYQNRLHLPGQTINLNQWDDQALLLTAAPPCPGPDNTKSD